MFALLKGIFWKVDFVLFRVFNLKTISIASLMFALYSLTSFAMQCNSDETNAAFATICEVIMFMQGRIGRSIATFSIMMSAWSFTNGKLTWQDIVTTALGVGLFFAPKTLALFLLPNVVTGLSGAFNSNQAYSPDEILTCMCPNLR